MCQERRCETMEKWKDGSAKYDGDKDFFDGGGGQAAKARARQNQILYTTVLMFSVTFSFCITLLLNRINLIFLNYI